MALTRIRAQQISNIDYKQAVRVVTTSNINLTGGAPGTVDNVTLVANDRILVAGQTDQTQNGLYFVQTLGGGPNGTWVRTSDTNTNGEMQAGMVVTVTAGTSYADTLWTLAAPDPIIIGTTLITFQQSTAHGFGNIVADTTAILAGTVGANISFLPGNNISIVGNNTAKTITIGVTGIETSEISNGTSTVAIAAANGNVAVSVDGTSNVAVFTAAGANVTGAIEASGNITGDYFIGNGSQLTGLPEQYGNANVAAYLPTYTGNIGAGNITATGNVSANYFFGNGSQLSGIITSVANINNGTSNVSIDAADANITMSVDGTANIVVVSSGLVDVTGNLTTIGNITAGNIISLGVVEAAGNLSGNYVLGNGALLTGVITSVSNINNGTSNVSIGSANANVTVGVNGTGNVAVFAPSSVTVSGNILPSANITFSLGSTTQRWKDLWVANSTIYLGETPLTTTGNTLLVDGLSVITGVDANTINLSGNITGNNLSGNLITGTLTTAAQPNITSVGTLNGLTVTGPMNFTGNLEITGNINATGNLNYENVSDLVVGDPLIYIGEDNTGNLFDLGIIVTWNDGVYQHGGWARDASDGTWKLFGNVIPEPTTTVDFTNAIYEPMLAGSVTAVGNITGDYFLGNGSQLTGIVAGGGMTWTTQANTAPSTPAAGDFWYDSYTDKKYQYTNDGVSNYWVDQSFPTSYSSLAVTGNIVAGNVLITGNIVGNIVAETITANVIGSVTGNLTGNVFGNLIGNSYGNSTGTHIGNVTGNLTGAVLTAAQPAITSVGTLSTLSVTGNITTSAYFLGDGSQLTGISSTGSFIANGTSNISIVTSNGNITAAVGGTEILKITSAGIENSRANGVGNIGSSTTYFNTVFAKATSAQYADLAEMYVADAKYSPGTVLVFGGEHEVTVSSVSHDARTAGVVSTNPSYLMNSGLTSANAVALALTGRVPCWVQGPVEKGDRLVNVDTGIAGRLEADKYEVGCVIGKSLEAIADHSLQLIEIAIGRY